MKSEDDVLNFIEQHLQNHFMLKNAIKEDIPLKIYSELSLVGYVHNDDFETQMQRDIEDLKNSDRRITEALIDMYNNNLKAREMETIGKMSLKYHLLKETTTASYPGNITLSYPGFSDDGTVGVIYMGHILNYDGEGRLYAYLIKNKHLSELSLDIGSGWMT
jgi:hypothetical protein